MKVLVVFSCLLGSVFAGYESLASVTNELSALAHGHGEIGPLGVPYDTDEVAAAKAVHFAEHAKAKSRLYGGGKDEGPVETPDVQLAKYQHAIAHNEAKLLLHNPSLAHANGPVDTPEVQVARAEHQAAYDEAKLRASNPAFAHAAGPVDTFEVQKAKVAHFHAHAQAQAQALYGHEPTETAEVQFARIKNFAASAEAAVSQQHEAAQAALDHQAASYYDAGAAGQDEHHY